MGCLCLQEKLINYLQTNCLQLNRSEGLSLLRKSGFKSNHPYKPFGLLGWLYFQAHFAYHDILMSGRRPIKWRQCQDIDHSC